MIPDENVPSSPRGFPTTYTLSPTAGVVAEVIASDGAEPLTLRSARSALRSTATVPNICIVSVDPTSLAVPLDAPSITCAFVAMIPLETKNPLPRLSGWPLESFISKSTTDLNAVLATSRGDWPGQTVQVESRSNGILANLIWPSSGGTLTLSPERSPSYEKAGYLPRPLRKIREPFLLPKGRLL